MRSYGSEAEIGTRLELAYHYVQLGKEEAALVQYSAILAFAPDHLETLVRLGNFHLRRGNRSASLDLCRRAIERHPDAPEIYKAHYLAGYIHLEERRLELAEKAFLAAVEIEPSYAQAWNNLAYLQVLKKDFGAAAQAYTRATTADPEFAEAHFNLGNIHLQQGALQKAGERYRAALNGDSTFVKAHYALGALHERMNQPQQALKAYRAFLTSWRGDAALARAAQEKISHLGGTQ